MNVYDDIQAERTAQQVKWGVQDHPSGAEASYKWLADSCRNACDENAEDDTLTWLHIAAEEFWEAFSEPDPLKRRVELVQLAAVIVAAIESEDRRAHEAAKCQCCDGTGQIYDGYAFGDVPSFRPCGACQ